MKYVRFVLWGYNALRNKFDNKLLNYITQGIMNLETCNIKQYCINCAYFKQSTNKNTDDGRDRHLGHNENQFE